MQEPRAPKPGIEQSAENSTLEGGMQAIQGDNNIQLQGENKLVVQKIFENVQADGNITVGNITQIYKTVNNLGDLRKPTGFPQNIPSSSTDKFVGREQELERLHQQPRFTKLFVFRSFIRRRCTQITGSNDWVRKDHPRISIS